MSEQTTQLLSQYFGFSQFRPGQGEVVANILQGQSAAAIFPTGAGKSLCYQLPATQLPHLTLVVSPLLALMQDQLEFIKSKGISAASIDSTQTREQANAVMKGVREGTIKILMISVERLNNERFRQFLSGVPVSLLVVDEAHCISEWGHNFRPDYLKLPQYRREFNIPQALLLTATATSQVIEDMGRKFDIEPQNITLTGFYRPNLNLAVDGVASEQKIPHLLSWLAPKAGQSGIVYVTLQQTAEKVAQQLAAQGINAQAYHAGMNSDVRQSIQQQFMQGKINVIVATIAFGMGIDKSDIRFVVHYDLPKSIENYAQEIGRAGRDGASSDCLVLANRDNLNVLENFVYGDTPESSAIAYVLEQIAISEGQWEIVQNSLSSQSNIRLLSLKTLLVYLEILGIIKPLYSYFAEYKYKVLSSEAQVLASFNGERQDFVKAIFNSSDKAKLWATINFDTLNNQYSSGRSRVITALDYLDQQSMIELQTKQMTQVYQVLVPKFNLEKLTQKLATRFIDKEGSEIKRIHHLLDFFASDKCLSQQLSHYFSDFTVTGPCEHCSVCAGKVAQLPVTPQPAPLATLDYHQLTNAICEKLGDKQSPILISRFLCGLTTPIFTRLRVRSIQGFARLETYPFSEVTTWVKAHLA
ncbi:MAG: RecQ family ATP-dependent DNA helicase [Gammaproteobacteria bacterium]|nr:RecQ family ATP-dependent DNA helicase [Gammaproteobacteria bacterium]